MQAVDLPQDRLMDDGRLQGGKKGKGSGSWSAVAPKCKETPKRGSLAQK